MAFIGWAWWSSLAHGSWLRWNCFSAGNTHGGIEINSAYSGSGFTWWRQGNPRTITTPAMAVPFVLRGTGSPTSTDEPWTQGSYRESLEHMLRRRNPDAWVVFIPHWMNLMAVALAWAAAMRWRTARKTTTPADA